MLLNYYMGAVKPTNDMLQPINKYICIKRKSLHKYKYLTIGKVYEGQEWNSFGQITVTNDTGFQENYDFRCFVPYNEATAALYSNPSTTD